MSATEQITANEPAWWPVLKANVASLKFGVVQVVVHDSQVVQIERTEKVRLGKELPAAVQNAPAKVGEL